MYVGTDFLVWKWKTQKRKKQQKNRHPLVAHPNKSLQNKRERKQPPSLSQHLLVSLSQKKNAHISWAYRLASFNVLSSSSFPLPLCLYLEMEARIMVEDLLNFTLDVGEEDYHYDENTLKAPSSTTSNSQDPDEPVSSPYPPNSFSFRHLGRLQILSEFVHDSEFFGGFYGSLGASNVVTRPIFCRLGRVRPSRDWVWWVGLCWGGCFDVFFEKIGNYSVARSPATWCSQSF